MAVTDVRGRATPLPDVGLLELAAAGDVEAFDALLRPRLDKLFRIAVAILRSEPDARDAVQEASLHAWRELPRLRDRDRFDAWITQIVVNACRSLLRRQRRIRLREIPVDPPGESTGKPDPTTHGSLADVPETEAIRAAFDRLDPTARSLLVLHYVEERPLAEIGRIVGAPTGTVKWRLWRARRALDRALEAERR